ncbi:MAG: Zn-ribbon domain-containing OB-fold protein [Novosphingobium sp.]
MVIEGERLACPACGARGSLESLALGRSGTVAAHTLVHRSLPGIPTPFFAVVVDLDGGGSVRGTLMGADPNVELPAGQRVAMVFGESGQRNAEGKPFLCYHFVPEGSAGE